MICHGWEYGGRSNDPRLRFQATALKDQGQPIALHHLHLLNCSNVGKAIGSTDPPSPNVP